MRRCPETLIILALALLALAPTARALPGDQEQPIHIEADEALRDENQGFTRYEGNVTLEQGSLEIEADQLTVYHRGEDARRITARGQPALMRQQPEADKGVIIARALRIEYFRQEARVELRDSASIEQEGSTVTGDKIDYFINEKLVRADSDRSNIASRVQVVIPAQALQVSEDPNAPADTGGVAQDPNAPADTGAVAQDPNQAASGDDAGDQPAEADSATADSP